MAVEFGVLGSIEARVDGRLVDLGHTRQRLLLAALLMDANHEVPVNVLAERTWGKEQVRRGTLYSYLSRLRRALAAAEDVEIVRGPAGYLLTVDPAAVDLYRFRELAARARATDDDKQAADLFGQALDLWRGQALAMSDTSWADTVREELHRERLATELDRGEARLRLGRHVELLTSLRAVSEDYPLDERLAGQLILALYRCGRTAEALGHYRHVQGALARKPGSEPGPELQRLRRQILTRDPALTLSTETATAAAGAAPVPVPQQLPASLPLFTGRANELAVMSAVLESREHRGGTVVISAIGGTGGIGKTYLALQWSHEHVEHFPDGQLYVDLCGFDPATEPMDPMAAVRGFLEALGAESSALPADPSAQTALYRSLVAGRRMLVVLDNARDSAQVIPLLPGSPSCTVLVTSRNQLSALTATYGAQPLPLDALPETEARQLLVSHLGEDRLAAEPEAVTALLRHCAGLPLALSIMAARAAVQPDLPLAHLAEELTGTETRLDALDTGELAAGLRAVFSSSYDILSAEAARALALLGLAPGPDVSLRAAASLVATAAPRARALLRVLENAHLIQQYVPDRYRMHDLVGLYAAERGRRDLDEQERTEALRRLVDFYLHTAHHASLLPEPQPLLPVELAPPASGCTPYQPADHLAAADWYHTERACLPAAQRLAADLGWHGLAWQLPHQLYPFQRHRAHFRDMLTLWKVGLASAEQLPDPRPKAVAHCHIGYAHGVAGRLTEAFHHLEQALAVFEQAEDVPGQAFAHFHLSAVVTWNLTVKEVARGLHHGERASELFRSLGNAVGEFYALSTGMTWPLAVLGETQRALSSCERAITLARPLNLPPAEALILLMRGITLHRGGEYAQALDCYHESAARYRALASSYWEANALSLIGKTHRVLGHTAEARHAWQRALDLYLAQHHTAEAGRLRERLEALDGVAADE